MGIFDLFRSPSRAVADRVEPTLTASTDLAVAPSNLAHPESWLVDWASGGMPQAWGPAVSERSAMLIGAVYRSCSLLSGITAGMSLKVYRRLDDGQREEAPEHRIARLLRIAPFPGRSLTAYAWRELWMLNVLLWGNHYSIIRYDNAARVIGFEHVMPWHVEVLRREGRSFYRCTLESGVTEYVDQEDMLHVPGLGYDGIRGVSRITHFARNSISLASSLEERTGRMHENGATPGGVLEVKGKLGRDALDRQRSEFDGRYAGRSNVGRTVIVDEGSRYTPFSMSLGDLQTIEQRRFQISDISRFFGTPLHLLNETEKSTSWGSGLSENTLAFLMFTIDPELRRVEGELNYKLFDGTEYFCEYDRSSLLAMDPLKSAEVAQKEIASGTLLINERRRQMNRPPVEGGDVPLVNSTNVPLTQAGQPKPAAAAPDAPAPQIEE